MSLIRPKPRRLPGLGAAKLLVAAACAGVGASLLFHSTIANPPPLIRPTVPEKAAAAPTIEASDEIATTDAEAAERLIAPQKGSRERAKSEHKQGREIQEPRETLARAVEPRSGPAPAPHASAPPITPVEPAPIEQPEPVPEPNLEGPTPPVELPPKQSGPRPEVGAGAPDPAAPPPPPAYRMGVFSAARSVGVQATRGPTSRRRAGSQMRASMIPTRSPSTAPTIIELRRPRASTLVATA